MTKPPKNSKLYPIAVHGVFGAGIATATRIIDGGKLAVDALFSDGASPRTILADYLIVATNLTRTATPNERRAIRQFELHRKTAMPRVEIRPELDGDSSGTRDEILEPIEVDSETEYADVR